MADWDDEDDDVPQQNKYVPPGKRGGGGGWGSSFGGPRKSRWEEEEEEEDDWGRPKPSQAATSSVAKDEWDDSDDEDESPPKTSSTNNTSSKTKEPIKKKGKGKKAKFKNKKIGQDDEFDVDNATEKKDVTSQKGAVDADDAFLGGEVDESSSKVKKEDTPEQVVQQIINQTVNLDDFKLTTQDSIEDFAEKVGTKIAREVQSEILVLAFLKGLLRTSTKKMKKESLLKVTQMSRAIYNEKTSGKKSKKKQSKAKKVDVRGKAGANADFVDFQESRYDDFDMF